MENFLISKTGVEILLIVLIYIGNCSSNNSFFTIASFLPGSNNAVNLVENRCGGVIRDDATVINYKLFEPVLQNERCVWIVASPNASVYEIDAHFNFPPEERLLVIVGVNHSTSGTLVHVYPNPSEEVTITAHVLIVTFHTSLDTVNTVGFLLNVRKVSGGGPVNELSRYELFEHKPDTALSVIGHPSTAREYQNQELSLLVFFPQNNLFNNRLRSFVFKLVGLQVADDLRIHQFNASENKWIFDKQILGENGEDYVPISGSDIVLMAFTSSFADVDRGFFLLEANCAC